MNPLSVATGGWLGNPLSVATEGLLGGVAVIQRPVGGFMGGWSDNTGYNRDRQRREDSEVLGIIKIFMGVING